MKSCNHSAGSLAGPGCCSSCRGKGKQVRAWLLVPCVLSTQLLGPRRALSFTMVPGEIKTPSLVLPLTRASHEVCALCSLLRCPLSLPVSVILQTKVTRSFWRWPEWSRKPVPHLTLGLCFLSPFWFCSFSSLTPASGLWECALLPNDARVWIDALPVGQTPCSRTRTPFLIRIYFQAQSSSFKEALATLKLQCILHSVDYGIQAPVCTDIFLCDLQSLQRTPLHPSPSVLFGMPSFRLYS